MSCAYRDSHYLINYMNFGVKLIYNFNQKMEQKQT